jgi:hypothetical protein
MVAPPSIPTKNRASRAPLIVVLCVIGLPILGILIAFISFRASNATAIRRLEAKIKLNKEPLTLDDLAATYPPIPDEKNGAILLLEIWEKDNPRFWKAFLQGESSLPERPETGYEDALPFLGANAKRIARNTALPPVNLTAAKAYLHQQREHMDGVRRALQRPDFRFPIQVTNGFAALLPHLWEIKKEVQNFQIEALVATESGNVDGAVSALQQAVALGKVAATEPCLLGQLVGIACHQMTLNGMERLLTRRQPSSQQLQKLERLIDEMQIPGGLPAALAYERVFSLSAFDLPPKAVALLIGEPGEESGEASKRGYQIGMGLLKVSGIKNADRRFMLETLDTAISLARRGDSESLKQTEALFGNIHARATQFPPKIYSAMLLPALGKAATKFASFEARRRAAQVAVAVARYRLTHTQRLPAALDELVPQFLQQLPLDPFDGEPIRYKRLATGFAVYSVGADRVDDHGLERPQQGGSKQFDDTFIVER